jgi:hypothetical protein
VISILTQFPSPEKWKFEKFIMELENYITKHIPNTVNDSTFLIGITDLGGEEGFLILMNIRYNWVVL